MSLTKYGKSECNGLRINKMTEMDYGLKEMNEMDYGLKMWSMKLIMWQERSSGRVIMSWCVVNQ